ncbi:MAG: Protease HtpX [Candidatus Berkelbacteria bacterium Athens1014_28]|uniref:Protease HtpX homolog n=1 Tax=Candidatus Berkelbacteria bacterium Athens1014_28 TaxID=2017145 RepID=A0A554LLF6_9BACT|nr:MAG: Protease HtpX [Candidatus Berkelbacteria bacterium Athens1014_28]
MTIYDQIGRNRFKTGFFITLFLIFVIAVGYIFSYIYNQPIILILAVLVSVVQAFASYFWGDKIALSISHAKPVKKSENSELHRLIENLAITAGLPKPGIYLISDLSPNAFATGRDPKHSSVAVTSGLMEMLEKKELEGVIAHELSHIGNRDSLLMVVIVVLVGVVAMISDLFFRIGFWGGFSDDDNNSSGNFGLIFGIILAILAPIAATLIQLAISRKREFLADANGALLTRYPEGLSSALKKISGFKQPVRFANDATSLLYITNPTKKRSWFSGLFDTHPPVAERIKALEGMEK